MKPILDDRHEIFSLYRSDCANCKHFINEKYSCKAFQKSIPDEILSGEIKHRKPLPDQGNEIVFEPLEKK